MSILTSNISKWLGYDYICTRLDEREFVDCQSCGARMQVKRNTREPFGMYTHRLPELLLRPHDFFECPHAATEWHERATALLRRSEAEVSASIRALIDAERNAWLEAHCAPTLTADS